LAGKTVFGLSGVLRNIIFGVERVLNNRRLLDAIARLLCKDSSKDCFTKMLCKVASRRSYFDLARRNPIS
jgi:hypothetical protein